MDKGFRDSLIQFIGAMIVGWLIMYMVPANVFFTKYIPSSFFWLFWLVVLGVIARGWPAAPPKGFWKPGTSKAVPGIVMTIVWLVLALATTWAVNNVWPAIPLFPVTNYFGMLVFMSTLWYALDWGAFPVANKSGLLNLIVGAIVILVIAGLLWLLLIDLKGTPWAYAPFNPKGLFQADFALGLSVWIIAWVQIFGNALSMQNYPFYKLGQPLGQIVLTVAAIVLGYLSWIITLKFLPPTVSANAIAGSIIGWTLFHSVIFGYYPNAKHIQPKRGIYNLIVVAILVVVWIPLLRIILSPVLANVQAAGLPFDISTVSVFYTLHVVAVILLVHNFFWLRVPFSIPSPPLGPEEIPASVPLVNSGLDKQA